MTAQAAMEATGDPSVGARTARVDEPTVDPTIGSSVSASSRAWRLGADRGQASVELLAFIPLVVAITLLVTGLLAGYAAREAAEQAAVAAAVAQLQATDPAQAVRAASPGWARGKVTVKDGRATVVIKPRLPRFVADQIDATGSVVFDEAATR